MKLSTFEKWYNRYPFELDGYNELQLAWNGAILAVISKIKYKNRVLGGQWQHEDIEILIQELGEMINK